MRVQTSDRQLGGAGTAQSSRWLTSEHAGLVQHQNDTGSIQSNQCTISSMTLAMKTYSLSELRTATLVTLLLVTPAIGNAQNSSTAASYLLRVEDYSKRHVRLTELNLLSPGVPRVIKTFEVRSEVLSAGAPVSEALTKQLLALNLITNSDGSDEQPNDRTDGVLDSMSFTERPVRILITYYASIDICAEYSSDVFIVTTLDSVQSVEPYTTYEHYEDARMILVNHDDGRLLSGLILARRITTPDHQVALYSVVNRKSRCHVVGYMVEEPISSDVIDDYNDLRIHVSFEIDHRGVIRIVQP